MSAKLRAIPWALTSGWVIPMGRQRNKNLPNKGNSKNLKVEKVRENILGGQNRIMSS